MASFVRILAAICWALTMVDETIPFTGGLSALCPRHMPPFQPDFNHMGLTFCPSQVLPIAGNL